MCIASGERSAPGIPGPVEELPVYEGRLLHAVINMRTWPNYVEQLGYNISTISGSNSSGRRVRCVTLIREPLSRLRSLYTYARSGGEHWFRYRSGIMQQLSNQSISLEESVMLFWMTFGKAYLIQSHEFMMMNIRLGCTAVKMESFKQNYNATISKILQSYGIHPRAASRLLSKLSSSDVSAKSADEQKADAHVTDNKFSSGLVSAVKEHLLSMADVREMISVHKIELGYDEK